MRIAAAILLTLGLMFGPGYYVFHHYFNGRAAVSVELHERAQRWTLPDGTIQRFAGRLAYRPVSLDLHPERNLALIVLTFDMAPEAAADAADNVYLATLFDLDQPVLQQEIRITAAPGRQARVVLPPVTVRSPFQHLFVLEELAAPRPVEHVTLSVRLDAEPYLRQLVSVGAGLLLAGAALLVYDRFGTRRRRR